MKRRLTKLVVFLLLGAIVNVGVAWWLAMSVDVGLIRSSGGIVVSSDETVSVSEGYSFGASLVRVHRSRNDWVKESEIIGGDPHELLPGWGDLELVPSEDYSKGRMSFDDQKLNSYGVPMLAMWYRYRTHLAPSVTYTVRGGIRVASYRIGGPSGEPGILPIRLIWPGFAINTIFYAAILWLLTLGPFTARRMIRRKRGHCIKCGYDLRGDVSSGCPECGWQRDSET